MQHRASVATVAKILLQANVKPEKVEKMRIYAGDTANSTEVTSTCSLERFQ